MSSEPTAFPFPTSENHGVSAANAAQPVEQPLSEEALDGGIEESFPASDPVSVSVTEVKLPSVASNRQDERRGGDATDPSS